MMRSTLSRVLALMTIEGRRAISRAGLGTIPGLLFVVPSLVMGGNLSRAIYAYSVTFLGIGMLLVPGMVAGDRRTGMMEFFRRLPISRKHAAFSKTGMCVVSSMVGGAAFASAMLIGLRIGGLVPELTVALAGLCAIVILMILVSGILTPLFARLPVTIAIGALIGVAVLAGPLVQRTDLLHKVPRWYASLVARDITLQIASAIVLASWTFLGLFLTLYYAATGRALQKRGEPTQPAIEYMDAYFDRSARSADRPDRQIGSS